jgi:hypothetical protein
VKDASATAARGLDLERVDGERADSSLDKDISSIALARSLNFDSKANCAIDLHDVEGNMFCNSLESVYVRRTHRWQMAFSGPSISPLDLAGLGLL